jgi:phenylpropionate dioxygenase-like ring-hydroxylating dioxygenase large terminal subunit
MMDKNHSFLRNIWYYALPGRQLNSGKVVSKTLLGEPILFGRSHDGEVFALRDICPHRAIPLHSGRFDGKEVECCYHGWRFDTSGKCTAIPSLADNQTLDLNRFRVRNYLVREVQGNIWIYMPEDKRDDADSALPEIDIPLVPDFNGQTYQTVEIQSFPCYVDHAVIGLMDPAHVPFVHRVWWWRGNGILSDEVKTFDPSPYGFTMRRHQLERQTFFYSFLGKNPEVEISFQLPGVRIERLIAGDRIICNLTAITPISETETEVTTLFYTTLPWFPLLQPILLPFIRAFLNQDRDIVIKQQIGLQYNPPLQLIKDADMQAIWYYQLKAEYAQAISKGRLFENPVKEQVLRWRS